METRKEHWEKVYATKQPNEVSWTQELPKTSLDFVHSFNLPKSASIIDIGGGDSKLVDNLLDEGFQNITVLDISEKAIKRAKQRLGDRAKKVNWIESDVTEFHPSTVYDCWHDRATFHFLTSSNDVNTYLAIARQSVPSGGGMVIGTFSDKGPKKCSMLDVHQYTEEELQQQLKNGFKKIKCVTEDHITPFNTTQNFLFCSFKRHGN
jgi:ubiquinone/menaquinone biosynthesis C-methylase UbiE